MTAEPWCKDFDAIADMTDHQISGLFAAQAKAVEQIPQEKNDPTTVVGSPETAPFVRGGGQWDYLKSEGLSDQEAEAKLRKLRGE